MSEKRVETSQFFTILSPCVSKINRLMNGLIFSKSRVGVLDILETLKNIFIFRGLSEKELTEFKQKLIIEDIEKGANLFWEGDDPKHLFLLLDGKFKFTKQSESGKDTIIGIASRGESIGEIALFDGRPYPFSAQALEKSIVMKMTRADFLQYLLSSPPACIEVIIELSRRLREAQNVIKGMAADRVESRIIELLLKLAEKVGRKEEGGIRIGIILTRQDIAEMVGSTVETTIRVLSKFTKQGLIETKSKSLIIKDEQALKNLINFQREE